MRDQPHHKPLDASAFFADGRSSRPRVADTVAREDPGPDPFLLEGRVDGRYVERFPFPITRGDLQRGRERYEIFCAVCHDRTGSGGGMVVRHGYNRPPTYHQDRLRAVPPGYLFDVISNGVATMPPYRKLIGPRDRWRIIAYVRALQRSQHATLADVPPTRRRELESR